VLLTEEILQPHEEIIASHLFFLSHEDVLSAVQSFNRENMVHPALTFVRASFHNS
jgi:hypothetical protein